MKTKIKEMALVLAIAVGLSGVVYGLVFALQPDTAAGSMPELSSNLPADPVVPALEGPAKAGAGLFERNCADCHGDDAKGNEGPSLYDLTRSDDRISHIIQNGIKGEMPRFESKFNEADIQALLAFLHTLKS